MGASAMQAPDPVSNFNQTQAPHIHISTPTQFVSLPSKGLFYPVGHPLHGKESIEIKYMTAREEDILASESLIKKGLVIERFIESLIIDKSVDPMSLLTCDRAAIMIEARVNGYGPDYEASIECENCGHVNDVEYDLDNRECLFAQEDAEGQYTITKNGTCLTTLPKTQSKVEFRLSNGRDEKIQNSMNDKQSSLMGAVTEQLKRLVVSVNDTTDPGFIQAFILSLPAMDSRFLRKIIRKATPDYNLSMTMVCKKCDSEQEVVVPIGTKFFWPDS